MGTLLKMEGRFEIDAKGFSTWLTNAFVK